MNEIIQPIVTNALITVACLLVVMLFIFLVKEWRQLGAWIAARKAAAEARSAESIQNALWSVAQEAYAKAEAALGDLAGSDKMDIALNYAVNRLRALGIMVTADEIRAKIQEAWVKLDKIPKQQAASVASKEVVAELIKKEIDEAVQR
ncbi:phage holin, LLH family [Paenibacillus xylanexedens]|uniref:phage holin, LLH family n=1 Tax=Paenibacillus xylanexedens TaxID=528191 RepID=UPI0011A550FB|nr:phage holin, LLH family [Paenibacillus xylanexedens]